jgi:hypothetical protein
MPQFLLIDQPTQVYFPSEEVYREVDGSVQKTESDADLAAVRPGLMPVPATLHPPRLMGGAEDRGPSLQSLAPPG